MTSLFCFFIHLLTTTEDRLKVGRTALTEVAVVPRRAGAMEPSAEEPREWTLKIHAAVDGGLICAIAAQPTESWWFVHGGCGCKTNLDP